MANIFEKIFGTKHERDIKKIMPIVRQINEIYETYHSLTDDRHDLLDVALVLRAEDLFEDVSHVR